MVPIVSQQHQSIQEEGVPVSSSSPSSPTTLGPSSPPRGPMARPTFRPGMSPQGMNRPSMGVMPNRPGMNRPGMGAANYPMKPNASLTFGPMHPQSNSNLNRPFSPNSKPNPSHNPGIIPTSNRPYRSPVRPTNTKPYDYDREDSTTAREFSENSMKRMDDDVNPLE
jgi:hypothetical protein